VKFFQLLDAMDDDDQVVLGKLLYDGEHVWVGLCTSVGGRELVGIKRAGTRFRELSESAFGAPILSRRLGAAVEALAGDDVEMVPVTVAPDGVRCVAANVLRVVDCVDEERSVFEVVKRSPFGVGRSAGNYSFFAKLALDGARIPSDAHVFRIERFRAALVVSETMRQTMESAGCDGAKFVELEVREPS